MIEVLQAKIKKSWDIKMEKQVLEARDLVMMYNSRHFCRNSQKTTTQVVWTVQDQRNFVDDSIHF